MKILALTRGKWKERPLIQLHFKRIQFLLGPDTAFPPSASSLLSVDYVNVGIKTMQHTYYYRLSL